ncbi:MAG: hypothetical protein OEM97_02030 [Acidimicrobiia bacterium]|nr:hypothetical protein [Acidimicrobiia bacterium]
MRRHRFDPVSAIAGVVFIAAGVSAVVGGGEWAFLRGGRLWALLLFLGGIAVLTTTFRRDRPVPTSVAGAGGGETAADAADEAATGPITDAEAAIEELAAWVRAESEAENAVNLDEPPNDEDV